MSSCTWPLLRLYADNCPPSTRQMCGGKLSLLLILECSGLLVKKTPPLSSIAEPQQHNNRSLPSPLLLPLIEPALDRLVHARRLAYPA